MCCERYPMRRCSLIISHMPRCKESLLRNFRTNFQENAVSYLRQNFSNFHHFKTWTDKLLQIAKLSWPLFRFLPTEWIEISYTTKREVSQASNCAVKLHMQNPPMILKNHQDATLCQVQYNFMLKFLTMLRTFIIQLETTNFRTKILGKFLSC